MPADPVIHSGNTQLCLPNPVSGWYTQKGWTLLYQVGKNKSSREGANPLLSNLRRNFFMAEKNGQAVSRQQAVWSSMRNRIAAVMAICMMAVLTVGCGGILSDIADRFNTSTQEEERLHRELEEGMIDPFPEQAADPGELSVEQTEYSAEPAAELPAEQIEYLGTTDFSYGQLPEEVREVYDQLCGGIAERKAEFSIRAKDQEYIGQALTAVINDHPEFFWITGSASMSGFAGIGIWQISLEFNIPAEEIDGTAEAIRQAAQEYLASLPEGASEYEKVKAAYEFIILHTDYSLDSWQDQNIQSVFLYHNSVCAGYARAFKYLMDRAGVWCGVVEGYITDTGAGHAWNLVRIDGTYTYVDPSWGDPTYGEDITDAGRLDIIYDYLCLTSEEIRRLRHEPDEGIVPPDCTDRTYDYYLRNGMYYEGWDAGAVSGAIWNAVNMGDNVVFFKFRDYDAYAQAEEALFPEYGDSLLKEPLQQRMEWDAASSMPYYYSCSDELQIIKIYW